MGTTINRVPWPVFRGASTSIAPWTKGPGTDTTKALSVAASSLAPTGYRINATATTTAGGKPVLEVKLPGITWTPGASYRLVINLYFNADATIKPVVRLHPDALTYPGAGDPLTAVNGGVILERDAAITGDQYTTRAVTLTIPDGSETWKDPKGYSSKKYPAGGPVYLTIGTANGALMSISFATLTDPTPEHTDPFDGIDAVPSDTALAYSFAWTGAARDSESTATKVIKAVPRDVPKTIRQGDVIPAGTDAATWLGWVDQVDPTAQISDVDPLPAGLVREGHYAPMKVSGTVTAAPGMYRGSVIKQDRHGYDYPTQDTVVFTVEPAPVDPGPGGGTDPGGSSMDGFDMHAALADDLAPRIASYIGRAGDVTVTDNARAQVPVVAEYVRGYTRGHGWRDNTPDPSLRMVIVSTVARMATNPEQVSYFQAGDYTERPAVAAGWTLYELAILRRFRRIRG